MPYWRLYYHVTWAVKDRQPLIVPEIEAEVHHLLIAKGRALGAIIYAVNGMPDHVHIAASVPPNLALADWIGQLKGNSSHAVNHSVSDESLVWQRGYGVVSFGQKHLDEVVAYIQRQKEHHTTQHLHPFLESMAIDSDGPRDPDS